MGSFCVKLYSTNAASLIHALQGSGRKSLYHNVKEEFTVSCSLSARGFQNSARQQCSWTFVYTTPPKIGGRVGLALSPTGSWSEGCTPPRALPPQTHSPLLSYIESVHSSIETRPPYQFNVERVICESSREHLYIGSNYRPVKHFLVYLAQPLLASIEDQDLAAADLQRGSFLLAGIRLERSVLLLKRRRQTLIS